MTKRMMLAVLGATLAMYGCDEEGDTDAGVDSGTEETDAGGGGEDSGTPGEDAGGGGDTPTCEAYCDNVTDNCSAANQQYADRAECIETCEGFGWEAGDPVTAGGPLSGNTIGCRTYHGGAPAVEGPVEHCPHAGPTGGNTCGTWCEVYCAAALEVCTGDDAIYADMAECMSACTPLDDEGDVGATAGDTVQCRLYHLGVALTGGDTAMHCPHAAADGGGTCVGGWTFNTETPGDYERVDRMGMPAVATALVGSFNGDAAAKATYNENDPSDDAAFSPELVENLELLHEALSDDLGEGNLCSTDQALIPATQPYDADVSDCLSQEVAAGVSVVSLVVPDVLSFDLSATSSFPNGRDLPDQVIDVTLAVILLDLDDGHTPGELAGDCSDGDPASLNPCENDLDFLTTFPYLAAPHEPAAP